MAFSSSRLGRVSSVGFLVALNALAWGCSEDDDPVGGVGGSAGTASNAGTGGSAGTNIGGSSGSPSAGSGGAPDAGGGNEPAAFSISSPAFDDNADCGAEEADACDLFPDENTGLGDAENVSPEIDWEGAPEGTQSFAIALHDLAFLQNGDPFTHWVMWNIPGSATGLPAALPSGTEPGVPAANTQQVSFNPDNGYAGSGACGNVYEFVLYALGTPTFTPPDPDDQNAVQAALDDSDDVLGTATMRARSDPDGPSCD
jgi:Raf kinase inhibitor-like YbhB/YbcL family protein